MLNNIRIVLVQTTHPGNIGSAARAMKTMGLSQLYLVKPKHFPHTQAIELASGADDVVEAAIVTDSLEEALVGCHCVIGTSARPRGIPLPGFEPRQAAEQACQETASGEVAIVFGREHAGLTNEELLHCHYHVTIPSNPEYSSLNLAMAVQVICYELRVASLAGHAADNKAYYDALASNDEVEGFYQHLRQVMIEVEFLDPKQPKRLMPKIRRLFNRSRLEKMEIRILRGILTAVQKQQKSAEK